MVLMLIFASLFMHPWRPTIPLYWVKPQGFFSRYRAMTGEPLQGWNGHCFEALRSNVDPPPPNSLLGAMSSTFYFVGHLSCSLLIVLVVYVHIRVLPFSVYSCLAYDDSFSMRVSTTYIQCAAYLHTLYSST